MKQPSLQGKKIAILATDGFEESELLEPLAQLRNVGASVDVIAPHDGVIQGMRHFEQGRTVEVDRMLAHVRSDEYDALVLPGGLHNPDTLRRDDIALRFTRRFFETGKPVAAICHGPQILIDADMLEGRKLTSWPAIRKDIENAGGHWIDREVVVDHGLVTSRSPDDLPGFCRKLVEEIDEGRHAGQRLAANA
jgi:protease I